MVSQVEGSSQTHLSDELDEFLTKGIIIITDRNQLLEEAMSLWLLS